MKKEQWRFRTKNGGLYGLSLQGRIRHYWLRYQKMKKGNMTTWDHICEQWYLYWWRRKNL